MEITLPTDIDGFLSQQCPTCEQSFRVIFGEGSDEPIAFCPYCGFEGQNCWLTTEQERHIQDIVANTILKPELKKMESQLKQASGGLMKIEAKSNIKEASSPPIDADEPLELIDFPCCNETIKVERNDKLFCIICGEEKDVKMSESKKVFLSHKGQDKEIVKQFKATLDLLGYETWLDEDAMPVGTPLERGLQNGMKDSCGVVFFITPSFKDEGYLQTEIDYAVAQRREKNDKFVIITLLLSGENGDSGNVPDLLKPYVWKTPKNHLEALREIVKALPIERKDIDWREGVGGVVLKSKIPSKTTELCEEAKTLLLEAVLTEDGQIWKYSSNDGEEITIANKSIIPGKEPRTVARWVGGLEDLQRRRFIKDRGHEGHVFDVTREGYDAAYELKKHSTE